MSIMSKIVGGIANVATNVAKRPGTYGVGTAIGYYGVANYNLSAASDRYKSYYGEKNYEANFASSVAARREDIAEQSGALGLASFMGGLGFTAKAGRWAGGKAVTGTRRVRHGLLGLREKSLLASRGRAVAAARASPHRAQIDTRLERFRNQPKAPRRKRRTTNQRLRVRTPRRKLRQMTRETVMPISRKLHSVRAKRARLQSKINPSASSSGRIGAMYNTVKGPAGGAISRGLNLIGGMIVPGYAAGYGAGYGVGQHTARHTASEGRISWVGKKSPVSKMNYATYGLTQSLHRNK